MSALAKPKSAASAHRRAMLAKVHIAKLELGLCDDDYQAVLLREAGQLSAADCSDAELDRVLKAFVRAGFRPQAKGGKARADHPVARKARAMWISLYHLGAVRSGDEKALESFARRQLGVERLQWANQSQGYKLIEALKRMAERHGWPQTPPERHFNKVLWLQIKLCEAILARLVDAGQANAAWELPEAAFRLTGIELPLRGDPATIEHYQRLAKALGAKLRGSAS
ncbi:MAG: regulatory protein GemA [Blastomonas sp.]